MNSWILKVVLKRAPVQLVLVDRWALGWVVPIVGHGVAPLLVFEKLFACISSTMVLEHRDGRSLDPIWVLSLASGKYGNNREQIAVTNNWNRCSVRISIYIRFSWKWCWCTSRSSTGFARMIELRFRVIWAHQVNFVGFSFFAFFHVFSHLILKNLHRNMPIVDISNILNVLEDINVIVFKWLIFFYFFISLFYWIILFDS